MKKFSVANLTLDNDLLNIPIFMVDYSKKLINIAIKKLSLKNKADL